MSPANPLLNPAYGALVNTKFGRNYSIDPRIGKNGARLRLCYFVGAALLSAIGCSMLSAIQLIVLRSIPSKVIDGIVLCIAIVMAALHSQRARPNKGHQHKAMNLHHFLLVPHPKGDHHAPIPLPGQLPVLFRPMAAHVANIRNFINSLIPNHRKPPLAHANLLFMPVTGDMGY